ncbi:MAG: hypothetical protein GQ532_04350 [Methylomarinum sp.]|nr:hypothetical protein [Methylomarinum sp.]
MTKVFILFIYLGCNVAFANADKYCTNLDKFTWIKKSNIQNFKNSFCNKPNITIETNAKSINIDCKDSDKYLLIDKPLTLDNGEVNTIKNCNIIQNSEILLKKANLDLLNNNIVALFGENTNLKANVNGPLDFLFKIYHNKTKRNINVKHNTIYSLDKYSSGFIWTYTKPATMDSSNYDSIHIIGNNFNNLHAVLYLHYFSGEIKDNYFYRNSFGNIVFSYANNVTVNNNKILFSGNGTSGDGMTLSNLQNTIIDSNQIIAGSCYGIAIGGNNKKLKITNNLISDDITSALYFKPMSSYKTIEIKNNIFLNNDSWSIAFNKNTIFKDLIISNNIFHKGVQENPDDKSKNKGGERNNLRKNIYMHASSIVENVNKDDNIYFNNFLKLDKRIKDYSHVKPFSTIINEDNIK